MMKLVVIFAILIATVSCGPRHPYRYPYKKYRHYGYPGLALRGGSYGYGISRGMWPSPGIGMWPSPGRGMWPSPGIGMWPSPGRGMLPSPGIGMWPSPGISQLGGSFGYSGLSIGGAGGLGLSGGSYRFGPSEGSYGISRLSLVGGGIGSGLSGGIGSYGLGRRIGIPVLLTPSYGFRPGNPLISSSHGYPFTSSLPAFRLLGLGYPKLGYPKYHSYYRRKYY